MPDPQASVGGGGGEQGQVGRAPSPRRRPERPAVLGGSSCPGRGGSGKAWSSRRGRPTMNNRKLIELISEIIVVSTYSKLSQGSNHRNAVSSLPKLCVLKESVSAAALKPGPGDTQT